MKYFEVFSNKTYVILYERRRAGSAGTTLRLKAFFLTTAPADGGMNSLPALKAPTRFPPGRCFLYAERRVLMMYIALPAFCGMVPTFTPYAGPCWEYKCMIVRRKEYPTGYRLRIKQTGERIRQRKRLAGFLHAGRQSQRTVSAARSRLASCRRPETLYAKAQEVET